MLQKISNNCTECNTHAHIGIRDCSNILAPVHAKYLNARIYAPFHIRAHTTLNCAVLTEWLKYKFPLLYQRSRNLVFNSCSLFSCIFDSANAELFSKLCFACGFRAIDISRKIWLSSLIKLQIDQIIKCKCLTFAHCNKQE